MEQEYRKQSDSEQASIVPAIVSCVTGMLGMLMVATAPWLLLV